MTYEVLCAKCSPDENGSGRDGMEALRAENAALRAENAALRAENAELRAENAALRARNAELEAACGAAAEPAHRPASGAGGGVAQWLGEVESRRLLVAVVENSPSVIFVKDLEGRYILLNRPFEDVLALPAERLLGKTDFEIFPQVVAAALRAADQKIMAGADTHQYEEQVPTPDGMRMFLTTKFPIRDAMGAATGICGISSDITERKRAEEERAALQEQVIAAQRVALHELSTPLVPIADGVIAMPLVGMIDSARAAQILQSLLEGIGRLHAHTAILDITGVRIVDTQVANALLGAARAARLLGARVVLTGISPNVAQTLVRLDTDLTGITTLGTLKSGIAYALGRTS